MRTRPLFIVAGVLLMVILLFIAVLLSALRKSPQGITIRHVKSVQSANITLMTFEIKNHTSDPYIFHPFEVQVRNGGGWSRFQGFDITKIHPHPTLGPGGLASYTVNVTNLPAGSVVRFSIRPQKILLGVNGFVRRAELNLRKTETSISLNPSDRNNEVFGSPTEVVSEDFVEAGLVK